jgi:hypothetical protein
MRGFLFQSALLLGCTTGGSSGTPGLPPGSHVVPMCDSVDSDGDGIADRIEGTVDSDGDGTNDALDADSDGDGLADRDEAGAGVCVYYDSDSDGVPNFRDTDSDNDGLTDAEEVATRTDPTNTDTDGDGVTDLGEVRGTHTDPLDPASTIDEDHFFVVLPYMGPHESRTLRFGTSIGIADVYFLVDMTGSMGGARTNLINGLVDTIIPGIESDVPDVWFGAGGFDDYPLEPYGGSGGVVDGVSCTGTCSVCIGDVCTRCTDGVCERCVRDVCVPYDPDAPPSPVDSTDRPFYLLRAMAPPMEDFGRWSIEAAAEVCPAQPATNDIGAIVGAPNGRPDILDAVEGLPCHGGGDGPESYVPALFASASGSGLTWTGGSVPPASCPSVPDDPGPRVGYPCFRSGALPIVLLVGDNFFHNGPGGSNPYRFDAPEYDETLAELRGIGARVIGIFAGDPEYGDERGDFERIATDTGAVRADGTPLVFDISWEGTGLDRAVVDGVRSLVGGTPQDVTTRTENVAGNPDEFDATRFIASITPHEGYGPGGAGTGYTSKDATTFYGVIPGIQVDFAIDFVNDVRPPSTTAQIFRARILVVGNGVATLERRDVFIVVPPDGSGEILI